MDTKLILDQLENNIDVYSSILKDVSIDQAAWKPSPSKWSILEVTNHLVDEECEDFRKRIDLTLHAQGQPWTPIDPEGWVRERKYCEREFEESISTLLSERKKSIKWLGNLDDPNWELDYQHPMIGTLRAGDLLTSWLAHDYLHIRQITNLNIQYYEKLSAPFSTSYAMP